MPRWRTGYRYDRLDPGSRDYGINNANLPRPDYTPSRHSLMVDYSPSEFSRLRLQVHEGPRQRGSGREPVVRAVHLQPRRAWRAHFLRRTPCKRFRLFVLLFAALPALRPRRAQRLCLRTRMGRAGERTRRRRRQGLCRHHRPAGSAPHRGAAQPDRADAARRPGRLHRRRARNRLAAGVAAAIGQRRASSPASPGYFEAARQVRCWKNRRALDRADGDVHAVGQSAHPDRSAQHRPRGAGAGALGWPRSTRRNAADYRARLEDFTVRWKRRSPAGKRRPRR